MSKTGLDLSAERILQISLVVKDANTVAKRFSEIFGISWKLYDLNPTRIMLHDHALANPDSLKIAIGTFGGRSLKLIQPASGQTSYAKFLQKYGEGFYALGLGTLPNYEEVLSALKRSEIRIEMQGDMGNGSEFSILDATEDLGCRFEISNFVDPAFALKQTGEVNPSNAGFVDMDTPIFSGGKKINQVGIVVADEKKAAKRFEELLGIGNWTYDYGPPELVNCFLDEQPIPEVAMESIDVAFAMTNLGDIQLEIIRPMGIRPGGCHQRFIDRHGNGIQHVSFGLQPDYFAFVKAMKKAGIGVQFSASIKPFGVSATYFASQDQLGGFQLEIVGNTKI
jgi:hypothetical protein